MLAIQTLMVADGCNLSCSYCWYETGSARYVNTDVTPADYARWFDRCDRAGSPVEGISLTGGEPLLRPDFVELLDVCSRVAPTAVFTNGMLLEGAKLAKIVEVGAEVHVSIDHVSPTVADRVRGGTRATMAGIARMAEAGVERGQLCMVVTAQNWRDVENVGALARLHEYGLELIPVAVPRAHPLSLAGLPGPDREELCSLVSASAPVQERPVYYQRFLRHLRTLLPPRASSCRTASTGIFVNADGTAYLCPQRTGEPLGDVLTSSPAEILQTKETMMAAHRPGPCVTLDCLVLAG